MVIKAAGREREAQQEQASQAAERAEQLRAELTRARIELEFFERRPHQDAHPAEPVPARVPVHRRGRRGGGPTGVAVGLWLVVFYLLLVVLAHETPDVTAAGGHEQARTVSSSVGLLQAFAASSSAEHPTVPVVQAVPAGH